jgi:hypothetical protein
MTFIVVIAVVSVDVLLVHLREVILVIQFIVASESGEV